MAKTLKGFKRLKLFPITTHDATAYTPGAAVAVTGAQSFSYSPETSEWKQYADDGVHDSGSDWLGAKFTLQLAECPISMKKYFEGGTYDEGTSVYTYGRRPSPRTRHDIRSSSV
jgi:hypothetical protein